MGNTWYYTSIIPSPFANPEKSIGNIFECAAASGYSAINPETGRVSAMNQLGTDYLEFQNTAEAITFLASQGGLVDLWKQDINPSLSINYLSLDASENRNTASTDFPGVRVSLSISDFFFHLEELPTQQIATDMKEIFENLCQLLRPAYGYSADEDFIETFLDKLESYEFVVRKSSPPLLSWLNYFETTYATVLDLDRLPFPKEVKPLSTGVMISFFDYPWHVDMSVLRSINRALDMEE